MASLQPLTALSSEVLSACTSLPMSNAFRKLQSSRDEEFGFPVEDGVTRKREWTAWHYAVAVLLLFPLICIPILFGLVANAKHTTKNVSLCFMTS